MKKKKAAGLLLVLCMVISLVPVLSIIAGAEESGSPSTVWDGTAANYDWYNGSTDAGATFQISTAEDLKGFANLVNGQDGKTETNFSGQTIVLTADINLNERDWTPIGLDGFYGTFNGNYHTISGLSTPPAGTAFAGLFAENYGIIENLKIAGNMSISSTLNCVGVISAINDDNATIVNCRSEVSIAVAGANQNGTLVGAIAGLNKNLVANCSAGGDVQVDSSVDPSNLAIGGLTGCLNGKLTNCSTTVSVPHLSSTPADASGAVVGFIQFGYLTNVFWEGDGTGIGGSYADPERANFTALPDAVLKGQTYGDGSFYIGYSTNISDNNNIRANQADAIIKALNNGRTAIAGLPDGITAKDWMIGGDGYPAPNFSTADDQGAPILYQVTSSVSSGSAAGAVSNKDGTLYLVPKPAADYTDKSQLDAVQEQNKKTVGCTANSPVEIDTTGIAAGYYQVYAVDGSGQVSLPCVIAIMGSAQYDWYNNPGSPDQYEISTVEDLKGLANLVNGQDGKSETDFAGKTIVLNHDIDLGSQEWIPIGLDKFSGTFNGNYHKISGMSSLMGTDEAGLFGRNQGIIENLQVSGTMVLSSSVTEAGGIAVLNTGTIVNCRSEFSITISGAEVGNAIIVGGIAGTIYLDGDTGGIVANCSAGGSVQTDSSIDPSQLTIGGLVGSVGYGATAINCSTSVVVPAKQEGVDVWAVGTAFGSAQGCSFKNIFWSTENGIGIGENAGEVTTKNCTGLPDAVLKGGPSDTSLIYSSRTSDSQSVPANQANAVITALNSGRTAIIGLPIGIQPKDWISGDDSYPMPNVLSAVDNAAPLLSNVTEKVSAGRAAGAVSNKGGTLYLVSKPVANYTQQSQLEAAQSKKTAACTAGVQQTISTDGLPMGYYQIYAVDSSGRLSAPWDIAILGAASYEWYDGNPSADTFQIGSAADLIGFANLVNGQDGRSATDFSGKTILLTSDIDLQSQEWTPIGSNGFGGTFNGNFHTVSGFSSMMGNEIAGFFGFNLGNIENLKLTGKMVLSSNVTSAGGIAAANNGTVLNCISSMDCMVSGINGTSGLSVGSITGMSYGILANCGAGGSVEVSDGLDCSGLSIGGLVGAAGGTVVNCCSTVNVPSASGGSAIGKALGSISGTAINIFWNGSANVGIGNTKGNGTQYNCTGLSDEVLKGSPSDTGLSYSTDFSDNQTVSAGQANATIMALNNGRTAIAALPNGVQAKDWSYGGDSYPAPNFLSAQDNSAPLVSHATVSIMVGGNITAMSNKDGSLYLVLKPDSPYTQKSELIAAGGKTAFCAAGRIQTINTGGLAAGVYQVYAVDNQGRVSLPSADITVTENVSGPNVWDGHSAAYAWYGNGAQNVFYINTAADFKGFANLVNGDDGHSQVSFQNKTVILCQDIDLGGHDWRPIGAVIDPTKSYDWFYGNFDGQDHTVSNLEITGSYRQTGLFAYVGSGWSTSSFKNLHVSGEMTLTMKNGLSYGWESFTAGGIAGVSYAVPMINCSSNVGMHITVYDSQNIYSSFYIGCVTGELISSGQNNIASISNCYGRGNIAITAGNSCGYIYAGGLTGGIRDQNNAASRLVNCYSTVSITVSGNTGSAHFGAVAGGKSDSCSADNYFWSSTKAPGLPGIGSGINSDGSNKNLKNPGINFKGLTDAVLQGAAADPQISYSTASGNSSVSTILEALIGGRGAITNLNGTKAKGWKLDGGENDGYPIFDDSAPALDSFSPGTGASDVPVNTELGLTFSEPVTAVSGKFLFVIKASDGTIACSMDAGGAMVSISGSTASVTLPAALENSTEYRVVMDAGAFENSFGNACGAVDSDAGWNFTTQADTTPPTLTAESPSNGSADVPVVTPLKMTFSESVKAGASGSVYVVGPSTTVYTIAADTDYVAVSGNEVTITLPGSLDYGTRYHILIDHGAFTDLSGNPYGGLNDSSAWCFTTSANSDTAPPTLTAESPSNGSADVPVVTPLTLTFSESVRAGASGSVYVVGPSTTVYTIASDTDYVAVSGNEVTITLPSGLDYGTSYHILIDHGAFTDLSGNPYGGLDDSSAWYFTTAAAPSGSRIVTYNWNCAGSTEPYTLQSVSEGSKAIAPAAPIRSGYTFCGWFTDSTCATPWNFKSCVVTADTTLYAKWEASAGTYYSVSYDGNTATSGSVPADNTPYSNSDTVTVKGNTGSLAKPGYSFGGWLYNTKTYSAGQTFVISGDVTLSAIWIPAPSTYTATYSNNYTGGGTYIQTTVSTGSTLIVPPKPSRSGYTFVGWYKEALCVNAWNFAVDTITSDTTLYAAWSDNSHTYQVIGTVDDDSSLPISGAVVKVMKGNQQFGDTVMTDSHGYFIVEGVPNGEYDVVALKDGQVVTAYIKVNNGSYNCTGQLILPSGNKNSKLEIVGSGTPNVVENGLSDELSDPLSPNSVYTPDDSSTVLNGGTVEIRLTIQKNDDSANKSTVEAVMSSGGYTAGIVLDVDVLKTVTTSSGVSTQTPVPETKGLITLIIPLPSELQGKDSYVVYRAHDYGGATGLSVTAITSTANGDGEYIEVSTDKTQLTLHAKFFSTYAIGYSVNSTTSPPVSGSSGFAITASAGTGGCISPDGVSKVSYGRSVTYSVTPDEGYSISDVLVDGQSVGAVSSYTFTNVTVPHTISAAFAKAEGLPYYLDNSGKKMFIGFASDKSGSMKYIAPKGMTVQFVENPKNFTDIADNWGKAYIDFVTQREVFVGTGNQLFSPDTGMTRAMFAAVIGRLYERSYGMLPTAGAGHAFTDVDYGDYYGKYVDWATQNSIIVGIGKGKFDPNREITREEMAAILFRFAAFLGTSALDYKDTQLNYPDTASISAWAADAARYCQQTGIIVGRDNGYFIPQATATRAEVAAIFERFIELTVK